MKKLTKFRLLQILRFCWYPFFFLGIGIALVGVIIAWPWIWVDAVIDVHLFQKYKDGKLYK